MNKPAHPLIIDVEASGFGADSYPIEVGVALDDDHRFSTLITPLPEWTHWDADAEKAHSVSRELLQTCGKPVRQVADCLNELLHGKTLYSDGWVVDKPWLIKLFEAAGREMLFSVSPLELILSEQQMNLWHQTKDALHEEMALERHRASNDAWLVQQTYRKTLEP